VKGLFGDLPAGEEKRDEPRGSGRARLREPVRDQVELQVCDLDAVIGEDHPARTVWAYVERLDLSRVEAEIGSREGHAGHPALAPKLGLALWLYATRDGIGSARELARLCESEAAYRWLCGRVSVNHHTLGWFRTGQRQLIEELLVEHVAALAGAGLIDLNEIAQDGVRMRAHAGSGSFRRRASLEEKAEAALKALAEDEDGDPGVSSRRRKARQERAKRERGLQVERALKALAEVEAQRARRKRTNKAKTAKQKGPRASTTDADARVMKMADGGFRPAYNVQFASLPANGIIVALEVGTVGSDRGLVSPMLDRIAGLYGRRPKRHLADGGYQAKACITAAADKGVAFYCPPGESKTGAIPMRHTRRIRPRSPLGAAAWQARKPRPFTSAAPSQNSCMPSYAIAASIARSCVGAQKSKP
jgi:transposase